MVLDECVVRCGALGDMKKIHAKKYVVSVNPWISEVVQGYTDFNGILTIQKCILIQSVDTSCYLIFFVKFEKMLEKHVMCVMYLKDNTNSPPICIPSTTILYPEPTNKW